MVAENMIPFEEINQRIWSIGAEIFTLCAARLVTQSQIDSLIANGLEVISWRQCLSLTKEIFFGPIMEDVDHKVSLILTLYQTVVWHAFCLLHGKKVQMTDKL
jgi:hypothetical protein